MLKEDAENLKELCKKWDEVSEDPKLELFIDKLKHEFFDKEINPTGKLVIFSESVDTVNYLTEQLQNRLHLTTFWMSVPAIVPTGRIFSASALMPTMPSNRMNSTS